jgi:hypothetical protein
MYAGKPLGISFTTASKAETMDDGRSSKRIIMLAGGVSRANGELRIARTYCCCEAARLG